MYLYKVHKYLKKIITLKKEHLEKITRKKNQTLTFKNFNIK